MKFKYYIFSLLLAICGIILIPKVKALADLTPTPNPLLLNLLSTVPTSCYTKQFGDANCDGTINNTDYDIWQLSITNKDVSRIYADFNKDGMVNLLDFEIWRRYANGLSIPPPSITPTSTPGPSATPTITPTPGLVAQWPLTETSGTIAHNSSGSCGTNCNGALTNFTNTAGQDVSANSGWTATKSRSGSGSLMFDGIDDIVNIDSNSLLNPSNAFTITAWVNYKNRDSTTWPRIIDKFVTNPGCSPGGYTGYALSANKSDIASGLDFEIHTNTGDYYLDASQPLLTNTWNFIAVSYDGTWMKLWVNGAEIANRNASGNICPNSANFTFGRNHINAILNDVKIYNQTFSDGEMISLYTNAGPTVTPGITVTPTPGPLGLLGQWKMDEIASIAVTDTSGYGNNGNANGATIVDGKYGKARNFNGTSDSVIIPNSPAKGVCQMSLSAWAKPQGGNYGFMIVSLPSQIAYGFVDNATGGTEFLVNGQEFPFGNLPRGNWYHLVGTMDGTRAKTYLNGNLVTDVPFTQCVYNGNADLKFGSFTGSSYFYSGVLDEVAIYNRALTPSEVSSLYLTNSVGP